ncbi:helix-turn-helix transcriptional regulator [Micromonospora polyrhachis]|uniref:AraC-like DNA-binding protein n=1 Tax=Micromonospora polyrhachis TaxID=1282883 RepID=A0A7W7WSF4_9ACTN|nr:helix-turn-helix transcriptional regulator [Micromonospora polyrhachis]MBB4962206.1 AraC-like DNA-binding protein [Micromonospora polyrhachis]
MYRETGSRVAGAVLWWNTAPDEARPGRVLPDGCLDLIWSSSRGLLVAGPDTIAEVTTSVPGERYVGLRFPPGTGPAVFGVPAYELRDRRVPLAEVWAAPLVRKLEDRAAGLVDPGRLLESVAYDRLCANGGPDSLAAAVVARLDAGAGVTAIADALDLGSRQLHRRCQALFGYGPKTLARIRRMQRALALARAGVPAVEVAVRTGYADQPHLSREVRALAGVPIGVLLAGG